MAELDLLGCEAPDCEVVLPGADPVAEVVGAVDFVRAVAVEWNAPLAWPAVWTDTWSTHGHRLVHAWHDLVLAADVLPDRCLLSAEVVGQRQSGAGAVVEIAYEATDLAGRPLWSTRAGVLFRGLSAPEGPRPRAPRLTGSNAPSTAVDVPADLAQRYSEASGIWNPIHTDAEYAKAAGLPAPVLHGSATTALVLGRDRRHVQARFTGLVLMPSTLHVSRTTARGVDDLEVRDDSGTTVLVVRASDKELP